MLKVLKVMGYNMLCKLLRGIYKVYQYRCILSIGLLFTVFMWVSLFVYCYKTN